MDESHQNPESALERAVLAQPVGCLQCGYDLRGLSISGPCPECGFEIWKTVQHVVDPASRLLPQVRNPRRVGNALVLLVVCLLAAALLLFARPVAITLDQLRSAGASDFIAWTPPWLTFAAGFAVLAGLGPIAQLAPPGRTPDASVRKDLWLLVTGHLILGAAILGAAVLGREIARGTLAGGDMAILVVTGILQQVMIVGAVVLMIALRRVLLVIGERSREFRTSPGGRQRIREMIAALVGIGLGTLLHLAGTTIPATAWPISRPEQDTVRMIGTVTIWVTALMVVIGLAYLVVNAWWIRRSLRRPPPTVRDLVEA